jgi:4-azaleucine resistance transporter AzlC
MTALFVVVFVEQWESTRQHIPALLGLGAAILCLLIFGSDQFLIPTMIVITLGLFLFRGQIEKGGESHE